MRNDGLTVLFTKSTMTSTDMSMSKYDVVVQLEKTKLFLRIFKLVN